MATEKVREIVSGPFNAKYLEQRAQDGWRLVALEWERGTPGLLEPLPPTLQGMLKQALPFGLQVSDDCQHLEENPRERAAMELMLQLIVEDKSLSQVAAALNSNGFHNRRGEPWTQTMVFNLLPRLIEVAPEIRIPTALSG